MNKIIFIGTNNFAAYILDKLIYKKITIIAVFTKPDSIMGRGKILKEHPVKKIAKKNTKIKIYTPNNINTEKYINIIKNIKPKLIIVTDYGNIICDKIINIPNANVINIHPSKLPKLRGASPIQYAILKGYKSTGISIIKLSAKLDSGDIINYKGCKIALNDTYISLKKKLCKLALICLIETINIFKKNKVNYIKQNHKNATYANKIESNFFKIQWNNSNENINRKTRALLNNKNSSHTYINKKYIKIINVRNTNKKNNILKPGTIFKINKLSLSVKTKDKIINIYKIQLPGKKISYIKNVLNGNKTLFKIGNKFE